MSEYETKTYASLNPALVTYAFVFERWQETRDSVAGLAPLFAPIIKSRAGQIFQPATFAADLNKTYGISINIGSCRVSGW
jgi:hypothetical protein